MENKLLITILFVLMACHTGCMTTTQEGAVIGTGAGAALGAGIGALVGDPAMGAAIGAGAGALGGALIGDHIDNKREQAEKAQMYRQREMEGEMPVRSGYQQELDAQRSEESNYSIANETHEDFFKRQWVDDHWVYIPTNNPNEANLFRRVKDENGRWDFISININKKEFGINQDKPIPSSTKTHKVSHSRDQVPQKLPLSENEGIEEARKELEKELEAIRKEEKQGEK